MHAVEEGEEEEELASHVQDPSSEPGADEMQIASMNA